MATQVQIRRGTAAENDAFTGAAGELTYDTTNKRVRIHDGGTAGGFELKTENSSGDTLFADDEKAIFGTDSDLQIWHNTTLGNSYITDTGTGSLILQSNGTAVVLEAVDGSNNLIAYANGSTNLYYDNAQKLATTSTGIDVTGTVTADGLTVDVTGGQITAEANGFIKSKQNLNLATAGGRLILSSNAGDLCEFYGYQDVIGSDAGGVSIRTNDGTSLKFRSKFDSNGDISFYEDTGTTPKFFWDASAESLELTGGTTATAALNVIGSTSQTSTAAIAGMRMVDAAGATGFRVGITGSTFNQMGITGSGKCVIYTPNSTDIIFGTNNTERMRIDSSGNVLVGKTSQDTSVDGVELRAASIVAVTRTSGNAGYFRRNSTDGDIVQFNKDGATVGVISSQNSGDLAIGQTFTGLLFNDASNNIIPFDPTNGTSRDNIIDLGASSHRFDDIYATNGTIQTSDRNEKQDIEELSEAEQRVAVACKGLMRKYRWKDKVAEKGDNARIHFGIIAQDLQDAFAAEGLDAGRYAMFISSTWWETQTEVPAVEAVEAQDAVYDDEGNLVSEVVEEVEAQEAYTRTDTYETAEEAPEGATERTRLGVRYPELLAFIIAAI
jgi:hypothetical protein